MATLTPTVRIPKGLHHLESTVNHKFTNRVPTRVDPRPKQWVPIDARIKRWNIWPGDKVRIVVGKPKDKYLDEQSAASGWKIHTVKEVHMTRNTLLLDGVTNIKHNPIQDFPKDMDKLSEQLQNNYRSQQNTMALSRPVAYSNVQLCVEDRTPEPSVFATRLATSPPTFDPVTRRMRWHRYAAKLTIDDGHVRGMDAERGLIRIEWPKYEKKHYVAAGALESDATTAKEVSFIPSSTSVYGADEIPTSLNYPISKLGPTAHEFANAYIDMPDERRQAPEIDSLMPILLADELSPRFSRAKKTQGWNERREVEALERARYASEAVAQWEAAGRDAGLGEVLKELTLTSGEVRIRGRTRKEVREAAEAHFDELVLQGRRETKEARKLGQVWSAAIGQYTDAGSEVCEQRSKRRIRRDRKAAKQEERMRNLTVEAGPNTVLPAA